MDNEEQKLRQKKGQRKDLILGVFFSSVLAFLITVLGNAFYDTFIVESVTVKLNEQAIAFLSFLLLIFAYILAFLIYDYRHEFEFNLNSIKRFYIFFKETEFWKTMEFLVEMMSIALFLPLVMGLIAFCFSQILIRWGAVVAIDTVIVLITSFLVVQFFLIYKKYKKK